MVRGSPPCAMFSSLMIFNKTRMGQKKYQQKLSEARVLLGFAAEIYQLQVDGGRHFLHEHPQGASSWKEPAIQKILQIPSVQTTVAHLCQFGMTTKSQGKVVPVRKATKFMSTALAILKLSPNFAQVGMPIPILCMES